MRPETLMQQQMGMAGKLTVPSRTRTALQQKSAMDELRNNLHSTAPPNNISMVAENGGPNSMPAPISTVQPAVIEESKSRGQQ